MATNDDIFKNYVDHINRFTLERLIHKNAEEFKQALIDLNETKKEMKLSDAEYLFQIIDKSHQVSLKSSIRVCTELIQDYHHWLIGNYDLSPKKDLE